MDFHAVERNMRDLFRLLAARRPEGEVRELPGLTVASAGSAFQMFNAVFLNSPVADQTDLERRLALASVSLKARGLPWAFWVCEGWLPVSLRRRLPKVCERYGLHLGSEMPGMVTEALSGPERLCPGLQFRPVTDEIRLREFCQVGALCFHVPPPWFDEIFDRPDRFTGVLRAWVGYAEGQPVSTAAAVIAEHETGIYNIATVPEFRERGYGEAMLRHVVAQVRARPGPNRLVLQSTRQGLRLYRRLGFSTVTRVLVFPSI